MTCSPPHLHFSPLSLPLQPQITCCNNSSLVCYILIYTLSCHPLASYRPDWLASACISDPSASYTQLELYSGQVHLLTAHFVSLAHSKTPWLVSYWPSCSELPPTNIHKPPYCVPSDHFPQMGFLLCKYPCFCVCMSFSWLFLAQQFTFIPWKILFGAIIFSGYLL